MRGAGGGRPSKGAAARNRNKPTVEKVVLPREGRPGPAPIPLTELVGAAAYLWAEMWARPEATQWSASDVAPLTRLVTLQGDQKVWHDSKLLSEMRQLEDRYGMSPYARRMLRWVAADEEEAEEERPAAPVRNIRAVDPNAAAG